MDSQSTKLKYNLIACTTMYRLSFNDYRLLGEWLGCYDYVLPKDRVLKMYPIIPIKNAQDALAVYLLCDIYQSTMTATEQVVFAKFFSKGLVAICQ